MQERHSNRKLYFDEQGVTTEKFVIPYIEKLFPIKKYTRILEIGCGEGGNLMPFIKRNCEVVGVDLNQKQIERAKEFVKETAPKANALFLYRDIYEVEVEEIGQFDLIMMRDVIEHIHNQERFMVYLKKYLKPKGKIFFGFPPWRMPFGGHQQICKSKYLNNLPFFHLASVSVYKLILETFGEEEKTVDDLLEIKETGISIRRFEKIVNENNYKFDRKDLYFINPNYETKFGLKPRKLNSILASIPHLRDSFTTCYYCILSIV